MLAEARANGFLRIRGLTYRRLLSTALCFSRRRVVERQGGGKTAFRMLASRPVSRGRVMTSAIPLMCRGMTNHRHAVSAMPLTHHKPECHIPFLRRKSVGKGRVGGGGASSTRGIAPGSRLDSLRDIDRAISQRDVRVAFGEYAWGKETPRSSLIPGSIGARRRGRLLAWLRL